MDKSLICLHLLLLISFPEYAQQMALQRAYDEFKLVDIDGDGQISVDEFNSLHVKHYLSNYPSLEARAFPKFELMDSDSNGYAR
jgi:Ca2+-binding EF-hand superfamily protein